MKANRRAKRRARQQRKAQQRFLNPTPKQLRRERASSARLEYKPVIKAAQDQIRISRTAQNQLNEFYGNYRGEVGRTADKADQTYQGLYDRSRSAARDLADRYDKKQEAMTAEDQKSAAIRGANPDGEAAARNQAGESQRQNLMNADSQLLAQLGSAASGYLRNVALASRQGQRLDNRRERNIRQNARNDIRDAKKERNAKMAALRSDQRAAEREWRLSKRTLAGKADYNATVRDQTAGGVRQAELYSGAQRRSALAKERAARLNAKGRGKKGGGSSGYSVGEAMSFVSAKVSKENGNWRAIRKAPGPAINYLVDRGVDKAVAKKAVRKWIRVRQRRAVRNATSPWYG